MVTIQKNQKTIRISRTRKSVRGLSYSSVPTKLSKGWVEAAGIWKGKKKREALKHRANIGREWEKRLGKMYKI